MLGLGLACSSRAVSDDEGMGGGESSDPVAGEQPPGPGTMFSPCQRSAECPPLEFCVFPQGEDGFCTGACVAPDDPSNCDPPPGDQLPACFDIGLDDGRFVCALDCADAPCPLGMRCEQVASGSSERSICF